MKIIKQGTDPKDRTWRGQCHVCNAVIEAKGHEINNATHSFRDNEKFAWEICPVCKAGGTSGYGGLLLYETKE